MKLGELQQQVEDLREIMGVVEERTARHDAAFAKIADLVLSQREASRVLGEFEVLKKRIDKLQKTIESRGESVGVEKPGTPWWKLWGSRVPG